MIIYKNIYLLQIVSELLGSFGDNELSPECLYSAQHLFKPDAVSIPSSYTSWVSRRTYGVFVSKIWSLHSLFTNFQVGPLQSSKLYNEVRSGRDPDKHPKCHFETPYVVSFQNKTELAKPQELFTFEHPLSGDIDCNRFDSRTFTVDVDAELHGFGGYFETVLYKDITLSIRPETHSKGNSS